jgi:hypothetical protein
MNKTFSFTSRSNHEHVFVTTNNVEFEVYNTDGKPTPKAPCEWCKLTYEDMGGIPVTMIPVVSQRTGAIIPLFGMTGSVCDYRCALSHILSRSRGSSRYNTSSNSESWLRIMYDLTYPKGPGLEAAPHYHHLDSNGGTYTLEQYKATRYKLVDTGTFIMGPAKGCYQRVAR